MPVLTIKESPDAVVDVVTDAVCIRLGGAVATADAECVELVAIAVTVAGRDVGAATFVDLPPSFSLSTSR